LDKGVEIKAKAGAKEVVLVQEAIVSAQLVAIKFLTALEFHAIKSLVPNVEHQ